MAPWLNKALLDEVTWAVEDEKKKEDRDAYQFKHYLVLTKVQRGAVDASNDDDDGSTVPRLFRVFFVCVFLIVSHFCTGDGGKKKQKKPKTKKKKGGKDADREFKYYKLEDEVFHEMSGNNWFTYRLDPTTTGQIVERLVMLVPAGGDMCSEVFGRCQGMMDTPFNPPTDDGKS